MGKLETTLQGSHPVEIASRYAVLGELGRGGMAVVYAAHDRLKNLDVAIKRLEVAQDSPSFDRASRLFESEYVALTRLAHPRIVAVYDYGHDNGQPFYTQEMLGGGDLQERAPMAWRDACSMLVDVCSGLSLLHSRRLVHRDITPRNVRCTADGRAKLIDFGALAPFGVNKHVVGTPPCVAPEALGCLEVDGRADLYGLGATAYFALTGRHAYPARHFSHLSGVWRSRPSVPSRWAEDVPAALDELVMELLQLAPIARPRTAAETMERLSALADIDPGEQVMVPQSYLTAPNLFGRQEQQSRIRKSVQRTKRKRGGSILVAGDTGTGRTRFLDAAVLEAKLAGLRVARTDASDGVTGAWGAAQALCEQLLVAYPNRGIPTMGEHASTFAAAFPWLGDALSPQGVTTAHVNFASAQSKRGALLEALESWILRLSQESPLLIAIDDLAELDEGSNALITSLAHSAHNEALLVLATGARHAHNSNSNPLALFEDSGTRIVLRNLSRANTEALLASVFGNVPNLHTLSQAVFDIAGGNAKASMALAQHLLDEGVVHYEAGAWSLPSQLSEEQFPRTNTEFVRTRLARLPLKSRELLEAIALASTDALGLGECRTLIPNQDDRALLGDISTLTESGFLKSKEGKYAVTSKADRSEICSQVTPQRAAEVHARLYQVFAEYREDPFRAATHAWRAGNATDAYNSLLVYGQRVEHDRDDALAGFERVRALPADWQATASAISQYAFTTPLSRAEKYQLHTCALSDGVLSGGSPLEALDAMFAQLHHDAGLDIYEQDTDSRAVQEKLHAALTAAQDRFNGASERDRVFSPGDAIPRLARVIVAAIGIAVRGYDLDLLARSPRLGPLAGLAPSLKWIDMNQAACMHVLAGRTAKAKSIYAHLLTLMNQAEDNGEDLAPFTYMKLAIQHAMGTFDVYAGIANGTDWPSLIDHNASFAVNAQRLRMLSCEWQCDFQGAEKHQLDLELLRIKNSPPQIFEGSHAFSHAQACIAARDFVGIKQALPALDLMAKELPTWRPIAAMGRSAYHLFRGNAAEALRESDSALRIAVAGKHVAWATLAGSRVEAQCMLGHISTAVSEGREALKRGLDLEIISAAHEIGQPLAIACAMSGYTREAESLADNSVQSRLDDGSTGLLLGCAYETRARVAAVLGDEESFATNSTLCAAEYRTGHNPVLSAKFERLMHFSRLHQRDVPNELAAAANYTEQQTAGLLSGFGTLLTQCRGPAERAQETLDIIVKQSGGRGGFLYVAHADGLELRAQHGAIDVPPSLDQCVSRYVAAQMGEVADATMTAEAECTDLQDMNWPSVDGEAFVPMLLCHLDEGEFYLTGLAVILPTPGFAVGRVESLIKMASRALREAGDAVTEIAS